MRLNYRRTRWFYRSESEIKSTDVNGVWCYLTFGILYVVVWLFEFENKQKHEAK